MKKLKVITGGFAEAFEKNVNAFFEEHPDIKDVITEYTISETTSLLYAFIEYEEPEAWEDKLKKDLKERRNRMNKAAQYYENSDKMSMDEVLHDAG